MLLVVEIFLYVLGAALFITFVARYSKKWAIATQKLYINKANDFIPGMSEDFKGNFMLLGFRIMYIFMAVVFALAIFSIIFGPICVGNQPECSAMYNTHYIYLP